MGKVFLMERKGSVFTCATCNVQIASQQHLLDEWINLYEFNIVYNVEIGQVVVPYGSAGLYDGYEISCVNCCTLLGWKNEPYDEDFAPMFRLERGRIVEPPLNQPPPVFFPQD
ncbi:unnamed protein product [Cochlearia groenlandica]